MGCGGVLNAPRNASSARLLVSSSLYFSSLGALGMSEDTTDFTLTHKAGLADAIGSLVINFALFNAYLNSALTAQLALNLEQARALVLPLQPRQKVEMIQWYAEHHWDAAAQKIIKEICKRARALADYRNDIAHGDMIMRAPDQDVTLMTYGGKKRFEPKEQVLRSEDVAHAAMNALYLASEFQALAKAVAADRNRPKVDQLHPEAP